MPRYRIAPSLVAWITLLSAFVLFRITSAPADKEGARSVQHPASLLVTYADGSNVDLLRDGDAIAIATISAACEVCEHRREDVLTALAALTTNSAVIVSTTGDAVNDLEDIGYPRGLVADTDVSAIEALSTGYVPSFLVLEEGEANVVWIGLPNPIQVWLRKLRGTIVRFGS